MFLCPKCNAEIPPALSACRACGEAVNEFLRKHFRFPIDGKYQLLSILGIGGMGEVYKALHVHLHTIRVIKLMRPSIAGDPEAHDRFFREARLATRIQHPNVAALFDFSALPDGSFYMVWEYIEGGNLLQYVRERRHLTPAIAIPLACQALMGLDAIHRAGIVHRDVSPENLMVTRDDRGVDRIKIIDLGVAKKWDDSLDSQTRTGMFVGKFKYCSPEQLGMLREGEHIDGRADVYSFGLVLYEMLTGVAPFRAETPHQYLVLHASHMPRPLMKANPEISIPPRLESVIFRALAKDRNQRFATAADFATALQEAMPEATPTIVATLEIPSPLTQQVASTKIEVLRKPEPGPGGMPATPPSQLRADASMATPNPAPHASAVPEVTPPAATPRPRPVSGVRSTDDSARVRLQRAGTDRKSELARLVAKELDDERYAKADTALQTLKMHLGVHADVDGDYVRLRKQVDTAAASREAWFAEAIDGAKREGKPKEVQRLLLERDEFLGRRFGDPSFRHQVEIWLRRRSELLTKVRLAIAAESFIEGADALDELDAHLEEGNAHDAEYLAVHDGYRQAFAESSRKMRDEIVKARVQENIAKTRRLLKMYNDKFGAAEERDAAVIAAESWIRQIDGMRAGSQPARPIAEVKPRRAGPRVALLALLLLLLLLTTALFSAHHWPREVAELVQRTTSGPATQLLLDFIEQMRR